MQWHLLLPKTPAPAVGRMRVPCCLSWAGLKPKPQRKWSTTAAESAKQAIGGALPPPWLGQDIQATSIHVRWCRVAPAVADFASDALPLLPLNFDEANKKMSTDPIELRCMPFPVRLLIKLSLGG